MYNLVLFQTYVCVSTNVFDSGMITFLQSKLFTLGKTLNNFLTAADNKAYVEEVLKFSGNIDDVQQIEVVESCSININYRHQETNYYFDDANITQEDNSTVEQECLSKNEEEISKDFYNCLLCRGLLPSSNNIKYHLKFNHSDLSVRKRKLDKQLSIVVDKECYNNQQTGKSVVAKCLDIFNKKKSDIHKCTVSLANFGEKLTKGNVDSSTTLHSLDGNQ